MEPAVQTYDLDLVKREDDYVIYAGDQPLKTSGGNEVAHKNPRLLKHILTDLLVAAPGAEAFSLRLFQFQRDRLESAEDPLEGILTDIIRNDPFILVKTGNAVHTSAGQEAVPEDRLPLSFWIFSGLLSQVNAFFEESLRQTDLAGDPENPFMAVIRLAYAHALPEQKSVINLLRQEHAAGIILPLLLSANRISPAEYTKGVLSFRKSGKDPVEYPAILTTASAARDYLSATHPADEHADRISELIREGESSTVEFKSTLRWDLRQGKTSQQVERACLRTISAMLNSQGGTLLIGVRDDGSVEGIESDRLQTDDRWLLHLWNLIRACFGRDVTPYIQTHMEKRSERTVCLVRCTRSLRPVFLRQPGFEEEFCIRAGPASGTLAVSEALKYIADHFPESAASR